MGRREYRSMFTCAEPGCKDTQFFVLTTRAVTKSSTEEK